MSEPPATNVEAEGAEATRQRVERIARSFGTDATIIETHASMVLLAGTRAWKFRKAVDLGFLNYTTLEARRLDCCNEVRLNRRLAPELYLGVRATVEQADGSLVFVEDPDEGASIVDWVVEMVRVPAEDMLDVRLGRAGGVETAAIAEFARELAVFHERADSGPEIAAFGRVDVVTKRVEANLARLAEHAGARTGLLSTAMIEALSHAVRQRLHAVASDLERRSREGRVRDGHGDLHARNLCVLDGRIVAYDCLQFDPALRATDVASEIGFLAMDLAFRGRSDLADVLVAAYVEASGDRAIPSLLPFFALHYAIIRAMVDSIRAGEPSLDETHRAELVRAIREHALLAAGYASGPLLVLVAGLPLTGKSTLARAVAGLLRAQVVRSDVLRKELAGVAPTDRGSAALYTAAHSDRTYGALAAAAAATLASGRSVVVDAAALKRVQRDRIRAVAEEASVPAVLVWATATRATIEARMELRRRDPQEVSDADLTVHAALASDLDEPTEWRAGARIVARAEAPRDAIVAALAEIVLSARRRAGDADPA